MNTNTLFVIVLICIIAQEIQLILMYNKFKKLENLTLASLLGKIAAKIIHHDTETGETEVIEYGVEEDKTGKE